jgi:hypothetical protein
MYKTRHVRSKSEREECLLANSSSCINYNSGREISKYSSYFWNPQNAVELYIVYEMPVKASNSSLPLIHKPVCDIQFCYNSKYFKILQYIMNLLSPLGSVITRKEWLRFKLYICPNPICAV